MQRRRIQGFITGAERLWERTQAVDENDLKLRDAVLRVLGLYARSTRATDEHELDLDAGLRSVRDAAAQRFRRQPARHQADGRLGTRQRRTWPRGGGSGGSSGSRGGFGPGREECDERGERQGCKKQQQRPLARVY